ncbi:protein FAR1-RELATED SEQUENCE 5-like [Arachis hypogaea]|uniref:protein FAR1-RELATED SEQUENCE 5-like n=1 Tax=Arachis hypogaea TaxID=3818 RepID=UPI000DEC5D71|nr:protein FAR1-RELATED SEQUENCE 5-like [Arachis hypogaea]
MVDLIEESSHNQIGNVSAEEMDELLVDSDGNDVENLLLNSTGSIGRVNFVGLSVDAAKKYVFSDLDIAYAFYNAFGRVNRFSIRKFKVGRSEIDKRILWQTFVCSREGYRIFRWVDETNRKRAPKPETRCGCVAQMRVHIDVGRDWWYTTLFQNEHNHELVPPTLSRLLRSQRRMTDQEIQRMNNMRDVGISTTQIYMQFAEQSGGFENVRFRRTDMYNQIEKQRQLMESDVTETLKYLKKRKKLDPKFYWSYEVDNNSVFRHLIWMDGKSRVDFEVFGDVMAFDATYKKNKYKFPLVVFSGVNHHLQTIVFGSAIVADEGEGTYIWLLQRFVEAMNGKRPNAVITDGAKAMKLAIEKVFPDAHHRLCGWHLLRNATSNVSNPKFTQQFRKCMLGDYEIDEFEERWASMVNSFGVKNMEWVETTYGIKDMWATAHMRGKFFAGLRTTSRCEALHSQVARFVKSGYSIKEFLHHFRRWMGLLRNNEAEADYYTSYGFPIMQTQVQALERSGASVYTREVFYLFRSLLLKASSVIIVDWRETSCSVNYDVRKYCELTRKWVVSYWPGSSEFRCSCQRMESFGIPCVHIIRLLIYLQITELPESLILRRWTMKAKEAHIRLEQQGSLVGDGSYESRIAAMNDELEGLPFAACGDLSDFKDVMEWVRNKKAELFAKHKKNREGSSKSAGEKFKTWTDATSKESRDKKKRRRIRCSRCNGIGHNRRNCRRGDEHNQMESGDEGGSEDDDDWSSQTSEEEIDEMDFDVTIANQKGKYH